MSISVSIERVKNGSDILKIELDAESFAEKVEETFRKESRMMNIQGFRKGKAPRHVIEMRYGKNYFAEKTASDLYKKLFAEAFQSDEVHIIRYLGGDTLVQAEEGKPLILSTNVIASPEIRLGQYKGVEVPRLDLTVTEADVDREIERERRKNSRLVDVDDRPVQMNDIVQIDFDGKVDGKPFENGKAENRSLQIGSKVMVPGFEDQVIGHSIGEEFEVSVTLPENYSEELRNKEAVYTCKVNRIQVREVPEVNDDFVQDVSEYDSLAEYRDSLKARILEAEEKSYAEMKREFAVRTAVQNAECEVPFLLVSEALHSHLKEAEENLQKSGMTLEEYAKIRGTDLDGLKSSIAAEYAAEYKREFVLNAIAEEEKLEVSDEEVDQAIEALASAEHMSRENYEKNMKDQDRESLYNQIIREKTLQLLEDNTVEVEGKPEEADRKAEEAGADQGA